MKVLDVYLNEQLAGKLEQLKTGKLLFTYNPEYLKSAAYGVSISLPLQEKTFEDENVKAFFSGLLPEESVRKRLARYLGLSEKNAFALLEVVGGDCAGALTLLPHGQNPQTESDDYESLDDIKLKEVLELIKKQPMLAGDDGYRLSLAGAQDKLAVGFYDDKVLLMKGGAPTTHIIKPIIPEITDSVHNELFCMKLAKMVGIDAPNTFLHFVGDTPYYMIERYDRIVIDKKIKRVHQEDFCQALGFASEMKYQREGGPSIEDCQNLIHDYFLSPAKDNIKLLELVVFNYLIGNADAHGKNFSLLYKKEKPQLAPAYDLLSTSVYSDFTEKMAMKIGGKYKPKELCLRHFLKLTKEDKTSQAAFQKQIITITQKVNNSITPLKEKLKKEGVTSNIIEEIILLIKERSKILLN